jgi:iron complex outermembrane recepter protein
MKIKYTLLYLLFFLTASVKIYAQNTVTGVIKDKQNNTPVQSASVYFPDLKTGAVTNKQGEYSLKDIPKGSYLVEVSSIGYKTVIQNVEIVGAMHLDFSLSSTSFQLNEIILTGVPKATIQRENPFPVSRLGKTELQQNTSSNIIDAINVIPGVSQITVGAAISKPVIRGLGYNRVVVMNDGVRQEGQQWFDEFGIEIDENSVDKVEVLKGPASLSYGSDAMAGVINFLQPPTLPEGESRGSLLTEYNTNNGMFNTAANIAGNKKGFTWDILYTNVMAHDYKDKYDGYVWNSGYGENNVKGIFGIHKKWGYSSLTLSMFNLKLGIIEGARDSATGEFQSHYLDSNGGDSLDIAPGGKNTAYNYYPIIHQHVRHYKAVLDNSFIIGPGRLNVRVGLQENYRQEANDITKGDIFNNYFFLRTLNYDVQYLWPEKNGLLVSAGINGMQQSSEDRGIVYLIPEYNLLDAGIFSMVKKTFKKLTISGGLRFDNRSFRAKDLFTDNAGVRVNTPDNNSVLRFAAYNSNFSGFSGSIGVAYDFDKNFYGKLNLSRGFRAPNAPESGSNGIHDGTPFYEIGDPTLKPENSLQVDVTLGVATEDFTGEITPFVNKINNYIFPVKLESVFGGDSVRNDIVAGFGGPTFKYISGDAVLSGGEIMINIHPHDIKWLNFQSAFSTVNALQLHQGDSTKYLPYSPPDKIQSKLKFVFKKINGLFQNTYLSFGVDNYFKQDKIYYKFGDETVTPGYTLINVGLGSDVCSKNKTICTIYLTGNNLADVGYQNSMSRIKYGDTNNVTGRIGVFNMGRNFNLKLMIPFNFKK